MQCVICFGPIESERLSALQFLNKNPKEYTCLECQKKTDTKIKGIYMGFSGASPMIFADSVKEMPLFSDSEESSTEDEENE